MNDKIREQAETDLKEGAGHVKFGFGVGAASAASLLLIGTTCPLCYFVAPAMIAVGVHKRHKAKQTLKAMATPAPDLGLNWSGIASGTDGTPDR